MTYITSTRILGDDDGAGYAAILHALPTTQPEGLLARYAGPSDDGFVITAVWRTKAHWDRFATELLGPAVRAADPPGGGAHTVEYETSEQYVADTAPTPVAAEGRNAP